MCSLFQSIVALLLFISNCINSQTVTCETMADCSYNGMCKNKVCECFPQWKGGHCASLNIIPGQKNAGLRSMVNGERATTWGGGAVYDPTSNLYHMVAAEMQDSCGMTVWLSNSQIVHATSATYDGEYTRQEVVKGGELFSHEPNIVKALDTNEFVVYYTHIYPPATYKYPCTKCKNGETVNCPTDGNTDYARNWTQILPTKMIYTSNISDNNAWSEIIDLDNVTPDQYIDTNLACYIFPNGSLIGILRNDNADSAKTYNLITSTNWKTPQTYKTHPMLPYDNANSTEVAYYGEDPFIWFDSRYDIVHSLWHYTYNGNDFPNGIHAFSTDGGHHFHAFLDFGIYPTEWAYNASVTYTDGTEETFDAAERPHLILDDNGYTPLALTNGARVPNSNDYSITLLRPINQN